MYYYYYVAVLFLTILITESNQLNLCDRQSLSSENVTSYRYSHVKTQNCNCTAKETCVRKCCAVGFYATKGKCVENENTNFSLSVPVYKETKLVRNVSLDNEIFAGVMSCENFFPIFGEMEDEEWFYLQENGRLLTAYGLLNNDHYCLDTLEDDNLMAFVCNFEASIDILIPRKIKAAGMIISMPFLLATFIAYALLPDRNLHMKALMFYVINLMFGYLLLVIVQLTESRFNDTVCVLIGYFCLFFFIVSFFWMNVICIDIWLAFSGLRGFSGSKKLAERKRFYIYCGYAWGFPILHTLVVYCIQQLTQKGSTYNPDIGNGQCFFKRGFPELLYFYGPMGLLITINIVFFAITAIKIRSVKKDTSMLKKEDSKRHSYENDKQTFNLYLKLLFAMGINWSMEIISWAMLWANVAPDYIWYLTDFCNAIYGVFIFFIFVFKKNIWKLLKKRYYSFTGRPHLAHLTSTNTTRTTSYSTAHSLHEQHIHRPPSDNTLLTTSQH